MTLHAAIRNGVARALECDQSNARALANNKELEKTRPENLSEAWEDLKEHYLKPWVGLLTAFLLWLIGALLLVRLLPRMLHNDHLLLEDKGEDAPPRWARVGIQLGGWLLVAVGASIATFLAADAGKFTVSSLAWAFVLSLVGIVAIDQARRIAPRLQVEASGEGVSADHVRAILHTLGARSSRGLEVPAGTDATFLRDIGITSSSSNPVVQAVAWLISIAQPESPWRLRVQGKDANELNVELFRNHRLVRAAVVNRARLLRFFDDDADPSGAKPLTAPPAIDFATFAAAIAVTGMAGTRGKDGLAGATSWESVGLQHAASQLPVGSKDRLRILARAVEVDPDNSMAQVTYWNDLYRRTDDRDALTRYVRLLRTFVRPDLQNPDRDVPAVALRLRALYSLVAASVNLKQLDGVTLDRRKLLVILQAQLRSCQRVGTRGSWPTSSHPQFRHLAGRSRFPKACPHTTNRTRLESGHSSLTTTRPASRASRSEVFRL